MRLVLSSGFHAAPGGALGVTEPSRELWHPVFKSPDDGNGLGQWCAGNHTLQGKKNQLSFVAPAYFCGVNILVAAFKLPMV